MPRISVGEQMVMDCLEHFHIVPHDRKNLYNHIGTYVYDKKYSPMGNNLRPDFVITLEVKDNKVVLFIEFDGEQHYYPVGFRGERNYKVVLKQFERCLANDKTKNDYWRKNELPFLRISYQHRQKDAVMFHVKEFLMENSCHQATPVLKGSNPESIYYHFRTSDKELQQQQQQQFETAIKAAFEVKVSKPPQLEQLPEPKFFLKATNWPEGYGPSERNYSSDLNREDSWYKKFEELAEYQEQNGHCNIPISFPENQALGNWVHTQRQQYRLRAMTAYRKRVLDEIGFHWNRYDVLWYEKLEELRAYQKQHGNCNVPDRYPDNKPLATWVSHQRVQYKLREDGKPSAMSDNRIRILEEMEFQWNRLDGMWYERLDELKEYQKEHGHCNVPQGYPDNKPLASWVANQRLQYRLRQSGMPSAMTSYRIGKLEEVGFQWRVILGRRNCRSIANTQARFKILIKLIEMAKRNEKFCTSFSNKRDFKKLMLSFEMALYYSAKSLNQYSDSSTLANRIKKIIKRYHKERGSVSLSLDKVHSLSPREWQEEVISLTRSRAGVLTIRLCRDLSRTGRGT